MKTKIKQFLAGAVIAAAPVMTVFMPGVAHAAARTWTGAGSDANWSTAANWSGSTAPVNGDSVIIDLAATNGDASVDNIASLNLAGITFTNNGPSSGAELGLTQNLTVSGPITMASSVTTTAVGIGTDVSSGSGHTITLGTDVTVTIAGKGLSIGAITPTDTVALAGHTLRFDQPTNSSASNALWANVTGSGSVIYNISTNMFSVYSTANTYTGTTQLLAGTVSGDHTTFGSSAVAISNGADVTFGDTTNATINNTMSIQGVANGSRLTSLKFNDLSGTPGTVTFTVPNITLNGSTRFSSNGRPTVNLSGIQANGNCIEYLGYSVTGALDGPSNGFLNGPAGCQLAATSSEAPATPDTGFSVVTANPIQTMIVSLLAFSALAGIAYKIRVSSAHR
jgi:hypothetical protein